MWTGIRAWSTARDAWYSTRKGTGLVSALSRTGLKARRAERTTLTHVLAWTFVVATERFVAWLRTLWMLFRKRFTVWLAALTGSLTQVPARKLIIALNAAG